jgi:myo-inositol-1-phosphate synthase
MGRIRVGIVGVGNCASSLVQGIWHYRRLAAEGLPAVGLARVDIGGYGIEDIDIVCAFDIDRRKVGRPLHEAIFAPPNNTQVFCAQVEPSQTVVKMGPILDGVAEHMLEYPAAQRFDPADAPAVDVADALRRSGTQILLNYLPVGSQRAAEHYAGACLDAGVSLVNCMPVFLVSDRGWSERFRQAGVPCVGDDVKAQVGATITHRALARLFDQRGVSIDSTYQLNTAGNTDFLNMLERSRLSSKRISKTEAVQSQLDVPLDPGRIHIGPSDYVPFQKDNKVCFLRIEGRGFGGVPLNLELRLSVEDSPNSAGVVVDAIRCCQLARDAGLAGPLDAVSAWTMKHPPRQMPDDEALRAVEEFITEAAARALDPGRGGDRASRRAHEANR